MLLGAIVGLADRLCLLDFRTSHYLPVCVRVLLRKFSKVEAFEIPQIYATVLLSTHPSSPCQLERFSTKVPDFSPSHLFYLFRSLPHTHHITSKSVISAIPRTKSSTLVSSALSSNTPTRIFSQFILNTHRTVVSFTPCSSHSSAWLQKATISISPLKTEALNSCMQRWEKMN
jgi:hypothetical protein